jgi:ribosomal-protein-serine acetyltransferase
MFSIDEATELRALRKDDARELFALTESNREHLRAWLPWVDAVTAEQDTLAFLETVAARREAGLGPQFAILHSRAIAGVVGFRTLDRYNGIGEIGYWLAQSHQGRGIMTACCRFLVRYAFLTLDLNRIEIAAATGNRRSRAIPERLGFKLEGILRSREKVNGKHVDHAMYSLLRSELVDD